LKPDTLSCFYRNKLGPQCFKLRARGEIKDLKVVFKQTGFAGMCKKLLFEREEAPNSSRIERKTLSKYARLLRVKKLHHFN